MDHNPGIVDLWVISHERGGEGMMGFHILLLKHRGGNDYITNLNVIDNLSFVNYPPFNGF
jgi:hypothetical protein